MTADARLRRALLSTLIIPVLMVIMGTAAFPGNQPVTSTLEALLVVTNADGAETFAPADKAKPGDVVEYRLTYSNTGKGGVSNLQATLPIPAGMEYLPGTAKPSGVYASTDGVAFAKVPLMKKVTLPDGSTKAVEVHVRDYRYLRWPVGALKAGGKVGLAARFRIVTAVEGRK